MTARGRQNDRGTNEDGDEDGGGLVHVADGGLLGAGNGGLLGRQNENRGEDADGQNEDGGSFLENVGEGVGGVAGAVSGFGTAGALTFGAGAVPGGIAGKEVGESVGGAVGGAVEDAAHAVGDWAVDNAGHIADASLTVATGGGYALVDGLTGGLSEVQKRREEEEQRQQKFDDASKNLEGNGSVRTSDELLDDGKHGLEFFAKFLPIYRDWTGGGSDYEGEIVKEYDQLREIDFGAFREDATRLEGVHGVLLDQTDTMNRAFQSAKQTWQGDAADAAGAKVGTFTGGGTTLANETEALAGAITPAVDGIQQAVREYSKFVLDLGNDLKCADKSPEEAKDEVRKARGDLNISDLGDVGIDDVFSGAWSVVKSAAIGVILGGPIGGVIGQFVGAADAASDIRQGVIDDAKKWLDTAFKPEFDTVLDQFQRQSTGTQDTVQQAYDQLLQQTKLTDDPFAGLGEAGDDGASTSSTSSNSSVAQTSGDTGGGGGGGIPGGGTGGGGGAATPPGSGPASSDVGAPETDGGTPGQPGGGDTRQPGAAPDTVTLGEGEDEVTVAEPNDQGVTEVTVLGEDGQPKTFDVAFAPEEGDASAPGEAPSGGRGPEGRSHESSGPPGMGSQPPSESNERITPNEDGQAVIREGDRTITLEQGEEGELRVSIENGDGGPPVEQTVEFGDDAGSGESGTPGAVPREANSGPGPGAPPLSGSDSESAGQGPPGPGMPSGDVAGPPAGGVPSGDGSSLGAAAGVSSPMGSAVPQSAAAVGSSAEGPPAGAPSVGAPAAGMSADGYSTSTPSTGGEGDSANGPASTTSQAADFTTVGTLGPDGNFTPAVNSPFASMSGQLDEVPGETPQDRAGRFDQARGEQMPPTPGIASMQDADGSTSQGATGIASMGESGGSDSGDQRSGSGGMMGMGGMGGQQGGGDQERTSQWRTEGQLFEEVAQPFDLLGLNSDQDGTR